MVLQVAYALAVALLIVIGQTLWKHGLTQVLKGDADKLIWSAVTNIPIVTGFISYAAATILYMYVITRFKYGPTYALIVGFSLLAASLISYFIFQEKFSRINMLGMVIILIGVVLVVRR